MTPRPATESEVETPAIAPPARSLTLYARFGEVRVIGKGTVEHAALLARAATAKRAEVLFEQEIERSRAQKTPFTRVKNALSYDWPSPGTKEAVCTLVGARVKHGTPEDYEESLG